MNETSLCKFIGIEPKRFLVFRRNKVQKSLINRILSFVKEYEIARKALIYRCKNRKM